MYTDGCRSSQEGSSYLVKFSDDTALLSILQGSESDHGNALTDFISWCEDNYLDLNASKTKELIIDLDGTEIQPKSVSYIRKVWK